MNEEDIEAEELRIAEAVSLQYRNNKMSAVDLGERLKYLREYSKLAKRALQHMKDLEYGL